MKATEQYFPVVPFIMLYKVLLTDVILKCDHSSESYRAVLSCDSIYFSLFEKSKFKGFANFKLELSRK